VFCFHTLLLIATTTTPARHPRQRAYLHAQQSPGNASDAARNRQGESPLKDLRGVSRPFTWRKLYERCWDEVQTCSDRCKGERKRKLREEKRREKNAEGWAAAQAQIALPPDPGASIVQMQ
jgi:hypothetical protein